MPIIWPYWSNDWSFLTPDMSWMYGAWLYAHEAAYLLARAAAAWPIRIIHRITAPARRLHRPIHQPRWSALRWRSTT